MLVGEIAGYHIDPRDGRVAVRLSRIAEAEGAVQADRARTPVGYVDGSLFDSLQIGTWQGVELIELNTAMADRDRWDADAARRAKAAE